MCRNSCLFWHCFLHYISWGGIHASSQKFPQRSLHPCVQHVQSSESSPDALFPERTFPEFIQSFTVGGDPQTSAENPKHPRTSLQAFFCTSRLRSQLQVMLSFSAHVNPCKSNLQNTHYGTCQCFKRPPLILSSALCSSHPLCQDVPPLSSRKWTR